LLRKRQGKEIKSPEEKSIVQQQDKHLNLFAPEEAEVRIIFNNCFCKNVQTSGE
jgi:hypothetical protein